MKIELILIVVLIIVAGGFIFFNANNGGKTMAGVNDKHKVLVAYFSRTGEQYSVGNIAEGNTAIVAKIISNKLNGNLFEIKVAEDNYPKGYMELTEYAKKELQQNKLRNLAWVVKTTHLQNTL